MIFSRRKPPSALADSEHFLNDLTSLLSSKDLDKVPQIADLRSSLDSRLTSARDALVTATDDAARRTREVARAADDYAHEEPWRMMTGALAAGVLIGFCLSRR